MNSLKDNKDKRDVRAIKALWYSLGDQQCFFFLLEYK